jgi:curved DNA-binding protein CbpA
MPDDPYAELGLEPSATDAEIRQAYFALVRTKGPEKDPARFKRVRAAYDRVSSPEARFETGMLMLQPWLPPEPGPEGSTAPGLAAEVLDAARSLSDLDRRHFREDCREVTS